MKINHIKKIGNNKYEVIVDNRKIRTYDTVILNHQLLLKKEISEELLQNIEEETKVAEVYEKTLKFINMKLRSKKEVILFLNKNGIFNEKQDEILEKLNKQGLFQEDSYIAAYVHDRMIFSNDGPSKIKEDLLKEDLDLAKIESEIDKLDDNQIKQKLIKIICKKKKMNHRYSEAFWKQKILEQMLQLGYLKPMIEEVLETETIDDSKLLMEEAKKLYQKYQDKKNGKELFLFIKQKLYQKRYSMDQINEVLNELETKKD